MGMVVDERTSAMVALADAALAWSEAQDACDRAMRDGDPGYEDRLIAASDAEHIAVLTLRHAAERLRRANGEGA